MKHWILFIVLSMLLAGCIADSHKTCECVPKTTQECTCPGRIPGSQVCSDSGSTWEDCICLDAQEDSVEDSSSDTDEDISCGEYCTASGMQHCNRRYGESVVVLSFREDLKLLEGGTLCLLL